MKFVNITDKEIKQIQSAMRRFDDDWIAAVGTSFQDNVWRAQRKVFWELTQKLLEAQEVEPCEDAVSRQAAKVVVEKHFGQSIPWTSQPITEDLEVLPPVQPEEKGMTNAILIPKNATNGEVLMALFPTFKAGEINSDTVVLEQLYPLPTCVMQFNRKWWNAPYKCKESEE